MCAGVTPVPCTQSVGVLTVFTSVGCVQNPGRVSHSCCSTVETSFAFRAFLAALRDFAGEEWRRGGGKGREGEQNHTLHVTTSNSSQHKSIMHISVYG